MVALKTSGERCGEVVIVNDFGFSPPITKQIHALKQQFKLSAYELLCLRVAHRVPWELIPVSVLWSYSLVYNGTTPPWIGCWSVAWLHPTLTTATVPVSFKVAGNSFQYFSRLRV